MALASIEVLAGRDPEEKHRLLHGVRNASVTALQVPPDDPTVRMVEHSPDSMVIPNRHSDRYTIVVITMFAGRTTATKRRLYQRLVDELGNVDVPASDVQVVVHEPPMENWSLDGVPARDTDPGFAINI